VLAIGPNATADIVAPATPAAPAPVASPALPPTAAPAPAPETPVAVVHHGTERTVDRHGMMLLGGISSGSDSDAVPRVGIAIPIPVADAPALRIGAFVEYSSASASLAGVADLEIYALAVAPTVFYDWKVPIESNLGDFVVDIDGGLVVGAVWMKTPDEPYNPGMYNRVTGTGLRAAGAFQFRAHSGLVVSVEPLGVDIPLNHPSAPPPYTVTTKTSIEFALLAGYLFQ
jgi:hypothetical protein